MPESLCFACATKAWGFEPDMGDDEVTFAPGTCTKCGTEGIIFTMS